MQYNITYREKDGGWQYIISYKTGSIKRWMQKSKQGFKTKRDAKRAADEALEKLKDDKVINEVLVDTETKKLYSYKSDKTLNLQLDLKLYLVKN